MISSVERCLREDGYVIQPIVGDSMMPMLCQATDAVRLVPVTEELSVGDLPLYRRPRGTAYVLHRIVGVRRRSYLTCGDNRSLIEKVPKRWVLAVAQGYVKNGTYIPVTDEAYNEYVKQIVASDDVFSKDVAEKIKRHGRFLTVLTLLIPSFSSMRLMHPSLFHLPFLLPFFWLIRIFSLAFLKRKRMRFRKACSILFKNSSY